MDVISFTDFFKELSEDLAGDAMREHTKEMIQLGSDFWGNMCKDVFSILGQTPEQFSSSGWNMVTSGPVGQGFIAVGCSLVPLFFIIHFCSTSVNVREEINFESILKLLIKVILCEALVTNCYTILDVIFQCVGNFVTLLAGMGSTDISTIQGMDTNELTKMIDKFSLLEAMGMSSFALVYEIVSIVLSVSIVFTIYLRLLKVIVITPFSALAFATFSGSENFSQVSVSYLKYFLSLVTEALFMMVALLVCNSILSSADIINLSMWAGSISKDTLGYAVVLLIQNLLVMSLTVTMVVGARMVMAKILNVM